MSPRLFPLAAVLLAALTPNARAIVYRSDETDATALGLANQPQFSGTGIVVNGSNSEQGTGEAIAPNWILTAAHVVTGYTTATFNAGNGQSLSGTVYLDPNSDMALIKLSTPLQSTYGGPYTPIAFITPNLPGTAKVQPVGPLIWNVGYGNYGNYGGTVNGLDDQRRAGTNNVTSYGSSFLYFNNRNTSGTEFESSTGPGDSGGPMFLQNGYQWLVVGEVNGAGSNGFQDTDVTFDNFITTTTGLSFAPQAAPTSLTWNTNYLSASTAASKSVTKNGDGGGVWDTTRLNFVGATSGGDTYTYAWQNGTLLPVTFGVGSGAAGTVTLGSNISISNLSFAAAGSGTYTIAGSGTYALTLQSVGSKVTTDVAAAISAPLAGSGSSLVKAGAATLTLSGANTYSGGTTINAGTLVLTGSGTLGLNTGALVLNNAASTLDLGGTSQAVGGFTGTAGTTVTNNGAAASTLTIGTGNAGAASAVYSYAADGPKHQYRTFVSATGADNTFSGVLQNGASALSLVKVGTGTITLAGANTYSGGTTVSGGTLALATGGSIGTGALSFNGTGTLDLGAGTLTVPDLTAGTSTTAFTGAVTNGSLTVSGANSFSFSPANTGATTSALDLSGLTGFTYAQVASGQTFSVTIGKSGSSTAATTMTLANGAAGNTITASNLNVGTTASGLGGIGTLNLGNANTLNVNAVQLGGYRSLGGTVQFNTATGEAVGAGATLTLRNVGGGITPVSSLTIGLVQSGAGTNTAVFDTSAGSVNAIVNNVYVSNIGTSTPGSTQTGTLKLGSGTFNAGTVYVGYTAQSNVTATTNNATVTQNAGAVLADAVTFAQNAGTTPGTALTTVGVYNLGTPTTAALLSAAVINVGVASATASTETLNFNNGTISNYDNTANGFSGQGNANASATNVQNLMIQGLAGGGSGTDNKTLTINLASMGTHTFSAGTGTTITVASTALLTGPGSLTKAGAGTLILAGANNYAGATDVTAGTLLVNGAQSGAGTVTVSGGGTLLGGTGSLAAPVNVTTGAVGTGSNAGTAGTAANVGKLTVGALTLSNTASAIFDLSSGTVYDQLVANGNVALGGAALTLNVPANAAFTVGQTLVLIHSTGTLSGTFAGINNMGTYSYGGNSFEAFYTATDFDLLTTATSVPEPATWLGGALLLAGVGARLRRRRCGQ